MGLNLLDLRFVFTVRILIVAWMDVWPNPEREREREIHYVHSASLAYEDGIVFMSEPSAARQ